MKSKSPKTYLRLRFLKYKNKTMPDQNETSLPRYEMSATKAHRVHNQRTHKWLPYI